MNLDARLQRLRDMLGDHGTLTVQGVEVDVIKEAYISPSSDVEDLLREHPVRVMAWKRTAASVQDEYEDAQAELEETKNLRFLHYWNELEQKERLELASYGRDETTERDEYNRPMRGKRRIAEGVPSSMGRWRRNFSDDYVWGCVRTDETYLAARHKVQRAKHTVDIVNALIDALEHRARALSHLAAYHRDATR